MRIISAITISLCLLFFAGKAQNEATPLIKASDFNFYENVLRNKQTIPMEKSAQKIVAGVSNFDIQTQGSERVRMIDLYNGTIAGVWTEDRTNDLQFPARGTGYERYSGGAFIPITPGRIEANTRTGYPSIMLLGDSNEVVINHTGNGALHMLKRNAYAASSWTESALPYDTLAGNLLWPMAVCGGNDSMSIHLIALSEPTNSGGSMYNGLDGALLYYRSIDGGVTWDIQDSILPGLDATSHIGFDPDGYSITARDSIVSVGVFGVSDDVIILKSTDNGNTWTSVIANDFPLTKYKADQTYGTDINGDHIPDTIPTSDGAGSLLIDWNGKIHAWYGELEIADKDLTDGLIKYLPTSSGLHYWNESFGMDSSVVIADLIDIDSSGSFVFLSSIAKYNKSLTSFPASCETAGNQMHVFYSGLVENESWAGQQYRHVYAVTSENGGVTWNTPNDVSGKLGYSESVFPTVTKYTGTMINLGFQEDPLPGLTTMGDLDPITDNNEIFVVMDTTELVGLQFQQLRNEPLNVYPNPANAALTITLPLEVSVANVEILDLSGKSVMRLQNVHSANLIDVRALPAGLYFLKATYGECSSVAKFIKQ